MSVLIPLIVLAAATSPGSVAANCFRALRGGKGLDPASDIHGQRVGRNGARGTEEQRIRRDARPVRQCSWRLSS